MSELSELQVHIHAFWAIDLDEEAATAARAIREAKQFINSRLSRINAKMPPIDGVRATRDTAAKQTLYPVMQDPHWAAAGELEIQLWIYRVHDIIAAMVAVRRDVQTERTDLLRALRDLTAPEEVERASMLGNVSLVIARADDEWRLPHKPAELLGIAPEKRSSEILFGPQNHKLSFFHYAARDPADETFAVLLPKDEGADELLSGFLLDTVPDIARLLFKMRALAGEQFDRLKINLMASEATMNALNADPGSQGDPEALLERLSACFHAFSQITASLHRIGVGLRINRINLDDQMKGVRSTEIGWFGDAGRRADIALGRVEAEIAYAEVLTRESAVALSALKTRAELLRIRTDKDSTLAIKKGDFLIAIVGVALATLQAFDTQTMTTVVTCFARSGECSGETLYALALRFVLVLMVGGIVLAFRVRFLASTDTRT